MSRRRQCCPMRLGFVLGAALLPLFTGPAMAVNDDLPDIGSPSDSILSKQQEAQIGRAIYRSLRASGTLVSDPEVQEYVQDVGQKLAAHAQDGDFHFQFFVVDEPTINAFALPGGYVGVHSGLILATKNESELAGVLAHEISHVTQRHISRAVYANQRMSILTMAAMLGAILVGAASGSSDAVMGGIAGAQSMAIQQQINFTRSNEYEADRVGVGLLAQAGFNPEGMPSFFETLAQKTGPLAAQAPEFLRTHPVTVNRIAETRQRAEAYPVTDVDDATGYRLARARLVLLSSRTPEAALERFEGERKDPERVGDIGIEYGIALANLQLGNKQQALNAFKVLLANNPEVIPFYSGLAAAYLANGDWPAAERTFQHAMDLFPRNVPLTIRYAEALISANEPKRAHQILLDLYNQVPPTPEQVRQIALAAGAAGDTADAHYYMAEYHLMNGDLELAADQLRVALSLNDLDDVQRARFRSRLEQVQEAMPPPGSRRRNDNGNGNGPQG
jgi:predicted Zn-dependent protease